MFSGVSIIADVAESIAETQPISINRIEIWDRLIVKKQYMYEFTKYELLLTRIHFNIHWQRWRRPVCVVDNEDDEREILPFPGTKLKSDVWKYFGFYRKAASPLTAQNLNFVKSHLQTLQANVRK